MKKKLNPDLSTAIIALFDDVFQGTVTTADAFNEKLGAIADIHGSDATGRAYALLLNDYSETAKIMVTALAN